MMQASSYIRTWQYGGMPPDLPSIGALHTTECAFLI